MKIKILTRGFSLSNALHDHVHSRLLSSIGRYEDRIRSIEVTLLDINGPKGGDDMRCLIKLNLNRFKSVVMNETRSDMYDAINICSRRVKQTVDRHFNRARRLHRKAQYRPLATATDSVFI